MQYQNRRAALNDTFRRTFEGGVVWVTRGIAALHPFIQGDIIHGVRRYNTFDTCNDPHGEHNFGALEIDGAGKVFWKIDHVIPDMALDPAPASRVLTIMLAEEI